MTDGILSAEEWLVVREAYAETYPVRPLINEVDLLRAELAECKADAERYRWLHPRMAGRREVQHIGWAITRWILTMEGDVGELQQAIDAARSVAGGCSAPLATEPDAAPILSTAAAGGNGMAEHEASEATVSLQQVLSIAARPMILPADRYLNEQLAQAANTPAEAYRLGVEEAGETIIERLRQLFPPISGPGALHGPEP